MTDHVRPDDPRLHAPARPRKQPAVDRPTPDPAVAVYPVDDELVLYDPRRGQGFVLNPSAAHIWALCDGSRTIAAVAQEIATAYALVYEEALTDVCECLEHLRRAGLLSG